MPSTRQTILFREVSHGAEIDNFIIIGRGARCQISVRDPSVSRLHVRLEWRDGVMWIVDRSTNGATFLDGERVLDSRPLLIGMELQVGETLLVGTDEAGMIPVPGRTISEMCRLAVKLYGSVRLAAKRLGKSHSFVRQKLEPRAELGKGE